MVEKSLTRRREGFFREKLHLQNNLILRLQDRSRDVTAFHRGSVYGQFFAAAFVAVWVIHFYVKFFSAKIFLYYVFYERVASCRL